MKRTFAFVPPRFGTEIGGAETLVSDLARRLAARGDDVVILTTCAKDNRTWANYYPAGETVELGLRTIRFPVDERNLDVWIPLQIRISEGLTLGIDEELEWLTESVNSSALYAYIREHAAEYDAIFFAPYLFGTTICGSLIAPEKSFLIPCLHDESYAYLEVVRSMFRQVGKAVFNAGPEMTLARMLYGEMRGGEVGTGFECTDDSALTPYLAPDARYLVYLGRKETGKNVQVLIDYFVSGKEAGLLPADVKLVIAGGGAFEDLHRPRAKDRPDIIDAGYVTEEEKRRILKYALCLCQPSTNESFSIVLMEAWLQHTPVLVHSGCAVTKEHVIDSGGGLYFRDPMDFAAALRAFLDDRTLRERLGIAGLEYVKRRYSWDAVLARFDSVMEACLA